MKQELGASEARLEFARRLRALRVPRGFRTARSLARTLEIDENRYTRYERAEVEPDLDMIRRICGTLGVSPSELLGTGSHENGLDGSAPEPRVANRGNGTEPPISGSSLGIQTTAWSLAETAVALQHAKTNQNSSHHAQPLSAVTRTGMLYKALMDRPFQAITDLLSDPDLVGTSDADATRLKEQIDALVSLLKKQPQP